jgi:pyruvate/2-oxoglutarate dehydrogenase complex dihydrolipoamide acyltransferase (E2) component
MPPRVATSADPEDSTPTATLVRWLVADGARVEAGQAICEIETSEASTEIEAVRSGILHHLKREGDAIDPQEPLATIT